MAPIPKTMKAVEIDKNGGAEVLQYRDVAVPQPQEGEVLVQNDFIGVNYIDTYFRTGLYPAPQFPYRLGREAAGTILSLGPNASSASYHGLKAGDRVVYLNVGSYAQYTAAPAEKAVKLPAGISTHDAAAALLQGLTALTLIRESYEAKKGDWVLVHAAAGGVGLWLCQLLRAVGARTIATASTPEKLELARRHGAEVLIDYSHEDVKAKVLAATEGKGVAAVYDGVGQATFDLSLDCLARKGTLASFGNASGAVEPFRIARLGAKNAKVIRPTLFNYLATREEFDHYVNELFQFMTENKMDVNVHKVYPLSDTKSAQEDLEGRKTTGKLLLKP